MQPGVTVVLATIWLTVYAGQVGANTLRLGLDQYSPSSARRHGVYRGVRGQLDWKDQNPVGNQPFDLSIGPRRSISASTESSDQAFNDKYFERDLILPHAKTRNLDFSSLSEDKQSRNFVGEEVADENVDIKVAKTPELPSELPPSEFEDPFVADDTFQDQGPGSVEIYKLDLFREKPLLSATPAIRLPKNKSKVPKKTNNISWKSKTPEYKVTSPKMLYKQSNDLSTELPPNSDPFSVGGVPELQVGCEGLEAIEHKQKRSIDSRRKGEQPQADLWPDISPISFEMNYDSVEDEETDELVKIIKLENATLSAQRRGDMDAALLEDKSNLEKFPVRGDLGKFNLNGSAREAGDPASSDEPPANQGRRILWLGDAKRAKREIWGYGEDEGVVSSDELQTENHRRWQYNERLRQEEQRRRQEEERRNREEAQRRGYLKNRTASDVERIREDFERRQREEEDRRRRLLQEASHRRPESSKEQLWQEEQRRREEARLREEQRRREEARLREEQRRRQLQEEEARRREWNEETRRRQQQEVDRRNIEDRRRLWLRKEEEEERRRQPAFELQASRNDSREDKLREYMRRNQPITVNNTEAQRRLEEERKLREYIQRNQPIQVNESSDRRWLEYRRTADEVRQTYPGPGSGRRDHGPSASTNIDPRSYVEHARRLEAEQQRRNALRREEEARRVQSKRYEEQRRRIAAARLEDEKRAKELIEEEARRSQASRTRTGYENRRRFEEHRRRHNARLIPSNLVLNESSSAVEPHRQRQEHERQRMAYERWRVEADRQRQESIRAKQAREHEERVRGMKEQWRRQEEARLKALPVKARIIIRPGAATVRPNLFSRAGMDSEINFMGINPNSEGVQVPNFPVPPTSRPLARAPPPCVWAVVECCTGNTKRLVTCFQAAGCPGANWDPNPCRGSILKAAKEEVTKFYAEGEEDEFL